MDALVFNILTKVGPREIGIASVVLFRQVEWCGAGVSGQGWCCFKNGMHPT